MGDFCKNSTAIRVSKRRVAGFFKKLEKSKNMNTSVRELESFSDANDSDSNRDSGRDSRNSEVARPAEVVYESDGGTSRSGEFSINQGAPPKENDISLGESRSDLTVEAEINTARERQSFVESVITDDEKVIPDRQLSNKILIDISEAEITHLQAQLVRANDQIAEYKEHIQNLKVALDDAYAKHEHILSSFHQSKLEDDSKIAMLEQAMHDEACSRESIVQELQYTRESSVLASTTSMKKLADYEQQLEDAQMEISALKAQAENFERMILLKHEFSKLDEDNSEGKTPKKFSACRKRLSLDSNWFNSPKSDEGECLGNFVTYKDDQEDVRVEVTRISYRKRFCLALVVIMLLVLVITYLGILYFKEELRRTGILTITYHPDFHTSL